ncbi:putative bacteriochlorophyll 4-vinyl reductase [Ancylostoma caninum]|uniref:Putative bacteriochlorophyll 4-vinyl reductase n=1 Tax=Ancylostoma caninum TaxID=29170 RepID=A0A368HAN1_ANCCA|nr:putative bacteriochlorophyll 4-vinyl reductase [Ancylostoma caninum]
MTTRLIVKSLPSNCTEASLRSFFKKYGTLSDCTLKYTKEGKFRKFAFVGFDSEENAKKALQETNQSYMGSARLQVEECKPFGDANKPRAWSQYSKDSSAYKRKHGNERQNGQDDGDTVKSSEPNKKKEKIDPEYREFLEAQGVKNEETVFQKAKVTTENPIENDDLVKLLLEGITGDTKLSLLFTGLPSSIKQKNLKEWLSPVRIKAMKIVTNETTAAAFVTFNRPPDVRRVLQRNQEYIGGYRLTISKVKPEEEEDGAQGQEEVETVSRESEEAKIREQILETGRLFVRNLPFTTKEEDLHFLFKKFGEIAETQVIVDKKTGMCKGFAIVDFVFPESAVAAYSSSDGKIFKGRMLHIIPGSEKREKHDKEKTVGNEKTSYKKEKMAKLKANAGKTHSWNALFLGPNAIADTLAEKLGVEKGELLNSENGESAGVRLALAETRLVRETREFFLANGVCLDAFSRPAAKRSDTVIITKNLPAGVEAEELERMFGKFGEVEKVLMPPEGGISAIVVMSNAVDAKKAFKALAYSRFRTQPLYLEWAPGDVFGEEKKADATEHAESENIQEPEPKAKKKTYEEKKAEKRKQKEEIDDVDVEEPQSSSVDPKVEEEEENKPENAEDAEEDEALEPGATVFVKNLSFETTDENLAKLFGKKYRIKSAQVSKKLNPADPGKSLSMGFGFVQFYTQEEAKRAIKEMQGELLNGHCLELKISNRELIDKEALKRKTITATGQGKCTKLLVRNIPFQASIREIESLFSSFGEVKSIRIPKKVGTRDQHRGFGFVDFISIQEAKRAFEALVHSTHIYGRRLVLEWAKNDDSVEEMREKTAEKFSGGRAANRKQKKRMEAIEKDLAVIDDD